MEITKIREEVLAKIPDDQYAERRVFVGRHEYGDDFDLTLTIRIGTGVASDPAMRALDKLLDPDEGLKSVLDRIDDWEYIGGLQVVRNSGTVLFPMGNEPPLLGSEWTVKVMAA